VLALTVMMLFAFNVMAPAPRFKLWPPVKVKLPYMAIGLLLVRTSAPTVLLLKVVPAYIENVPLAAPRAVVLLIFNVPAFKFTPPVNVLVPDRVIGDVELF